MNEASAWDAAAVVLIAAAPDLAAGRISAGAPVLAAHLLGVVFLPPAVTGAARHLLPMMLRNDLRRPRLGWAAALLLLAGGPLLALAACLETVRRARLRLSRSRIREAADGPASR